MGDIRFREFHDAIVRGDPRWNVRALSDEELVSALAACTRQEEALRANVIATEMHNRLQERTRSEAHLLEMEERYRLLVEQAPEALLLISNDGALVHASQATRRILGWPPEEAIGLPVRELVHVDDRALVDPVREMHLAVGSESTIRFRSSRRPDDWLEAVSRSFDFGTGEVVGIVSIVREVRDAAGR